MIFTKARVLYLCCTEKYLEGLPESQQYTCKAFGWMAKIPLRLTKRFFKASCPRFLRYTLQKTPKSVGFVTLTALLATPQHPQYAETGNMFCPRCGNTLGVNSDNILLGSYFNSTLQNCKFFANHCVPTSVEMCLTYKAIVTKICNCWQQSLLTYIERTIRPAFIVMASQFSNDYEG